MNIVIDSNIFFSALIKNSITRKLILEHEGKFFFPIYIFDEFQKHKGILLRKSCLEKEDFDRIIAMLLEKVEIVPKKMLIPFRKISINAVKDIDIDDSMFIACCLCCNSVLWSNDKKLKKQNLVKVLNTREIKCFLYDLRE